MAEHETIQSIIDKRREKARTGLYGANLSRLALRSGVSRFTLIRFRDGTTEPSIETIDAVEKALRDDNERTGA